MNLHQLFLTKNECYQRGLTMKPAGLMLHSTGANNPNLKRYVGPDDGFLGVNTAGNHWNQWRPDGRQVCVHGFIGKLADGTIATYQTMPWTMPGWHSGKGSKGSANNMGYIGVEICEDGLADMAYFLAVYWEAVELFAYLCKQFALDPMKDILCHSEGYKQGIASNHGDVMHWFPKHGKSMDTFRADVKKEMEEETMNIDKLIKEMTDEQAYALLAKANAHAATLPEPGWSKTEGNWKKAIEDGITDGTAPQRPMTRCEAMAVLGRMGLLDR